ncbi:MAG: malto-oligosyltrehalose trehalohydrolase [Myxococcales bacterium]|jgi:maltooligosyltrehalose trehalohydrolase|nr:malto-oligosyltrehalose trehalohydrolase [Myxococcales bacterium]
MNSPDLRSPAQGAFLDGDGATFRVWAPHLDRLALDIEGHATIAMTRDAGGFFSTHLDRLSSGALYGYRLPDGRLLPDPVSRFQPGSVHERSMLVAPHLDFEFRHDATESRAGSGTESDMRAGAPSRAASSSESESSSAAIATGDHAPLDLIFYELHVGTFTQAGTLDAAIAELPRLVELGITAIELMPLCAFDGERGWGYDGVQPFAVHRAYGGPWALARFVDAAHALGLSVFLDAVYNHFGPSGCYLRTFAPYFTDGATTPWGEALDFTARPVRDLVLDSALFWLRTFHLDGLRLDAVHAIIDPSDKHILQELAETMAALPAHAWPLGRRPLLIAESNLNSARLVRPIDQGGFGLDAQWSDDFHHALHALLTGERGGYYEDYGTLDDLARAFRDGQTFTGQFSRLRQANYGDPTDGLETCQFVVASQNHDQVGNRARGERLPALVGTEALQLASAAVLLSPFVPLLFMGEEYGESAPFLYFTGFPDPELGRAVTEGRRREFSRFEWQGDIPDPQDLATFERSKLHPEERFLGAGQTLWDWYRALLSLRRSFVGFASSPVESTQVEQVDGALVVTREIGVNVDGGERRWTKLLLNFADGPTQVDLGEGDWHVRIDSHGTSRAVRSSLCLQRYQAIFLELAGGF